MSIYTKLARSSAIFAIGNLGSRFITLLMLPFYTRYLSQSEYGEIDIIVATIALILPLFTASIVEAIVRFCLDKKNYIYGEVLTNSVLIIVIGFILLICFYPVISLIDFIGRYGILFYSVFFVQAFQISVKQFARSINLNVVYMLSDFIYSVSFVLFNILLIFHFNMGVQGYFISMIIAYSINIVFLSYKTKFFSYIKIKYIDLIKLKTMILYSIPLIPNTIMWWVISISDRYLVTFFLGLSANGIYAVAAKFPTLVASFYQIFYKAWQVSAFEEYENVNRDKFYSNVFNILFYFMVLAASFYMILNKTIVGIMVSYDFYSAWQYAPILVLAAVFSSFSSFVGTNYTALKKTKGALYTSLYGALLNLILNIILIPLIGLYGAAISTLLSYLTIWLIRIKDTKKYIKINYPVKKIVISIGILIVQICIGHININTITFIILNSICLVTILFLGMGYLKSPVNVIVRKLKTHIR